MWENFFKVLAYYKKRKWELASFAISLLQAGLQIRIIARYSRPHIKGRIWHFCLTKFKQKIFGSNLISFLCLFARGYAHMWRIDFRNFPLFLVSLEHEAVNSLRWRYIIKHRQITICYIGQFVKSFTDCVPSSITYINITITTIQLLNIRAGRGRQVLMWWTTGLEVWARLSLHNVLLRKRLLSSTRFFSIPITI